MHRLGLCIVALVCVLALPSTAQADAVTFSGTGTGTDDITLMASATFRVYTDAVTGQKMLEITLQNTGDTSGTEKDKSANTLTGLFFDLPDGITLSPDSATTTSALVQASTCDIGPCGGDEVNVGGEFRYDTGSWSGHLGSSGLSSSGYIDGDSGGGNFGGDDLDQPNSPDGINFGIVAPTEDFAFIPHTNPNQNMAANPLINGEVVFTLAILTDSEDPFLASQISNVSFQYGTDISEPKFVAGLDVNVIPEPSVLLLFGSASVVGLVRRRSRARSRS